MTVLPQGTIRTWALRNPRQGAINFRTPCTARNWHVRRRVITPRVIDNDHAGSEPVSRVARVDGVGRGRGNNMHEWNFIYLGGCSYQGCARLRFFGLTRLRLI